MEKESPFQPAEEKNTVPNDQAGGSALPALVVGIGAAEGAMKSLGIILAGIPSGRGVAVVLVHHPELAGKNLLKLLKQQAALEVVEATNGMTVLADRIHVMPPDRFLNITAGRLTHSEPVHCNGLLMPIDHFFCSLADDRRNRCCGILLSGKGGDGTLGLSEIRAGGGRTIVEDSKSVPFPAMPQGAMDAGTVEAVLPAGAIAAAVAELAEQVAARNSCAAPAEPEAGLRAILDILHARVGHDFRCYKPNTITRRIRRRMTQGRIATLDDYARHLADHPDEADLLQKDLLIGVTDFFRQPQAWETLERKVITPLIENAVPGSVIRVWIPGCSSGKEVYSLAMLMAEQANVISGKIDFQIFATDADYTALTAARTSCYTMDEIGSTVSPERLKRFFSRRDSRYQVIKTLRGRVIFAAQNITADPPFSRLDLIICRNLLIYLDQPMQKKIIALFHFALREEGFLFLGNAETIGDREDLFEPILKKWRIYRRIGVGRRMNADIPVHPSGAPCAAAVKSPAALMSGQSLTSTAQQVLLERFAPACVMIDRRLQVLYTHGAIENYLKFPAGELTTRVTDMAREGLRSRLRGMIGKCIESGRTVSFTARTRRGEKSVPVKATVIPLRHPRGSDGLLLITFEDQRFPAAKYGAQTTDHGDVRQLADELKITREELQSTIDQLEGSNDQLKASNEEVMAANEELQASNEEMETSKEELQSLNEELNTINLRLQEKVDELESVNNDVVNLLASTSIATVFLDKAFRIKRYTPAITQLMSLIPSDRGRPLGDILMRFTDEALLDEARLVLVDLTPRAKEVRADDGRWHIRRVTPYRTQDDRIEGVVITFVDVTDLKQAEEGVRESRRRLALIVDSIADGFFALDRQWRFTHINDEALAHFRKTSEEVIGRTLFEVFPAIRGTAFETRYRNAMESGEPVHFEVPSTVADMVMEIHAYPGRENLTVLFRNVTERHRMVQALREAHERVAWLARFPEENPNPVVRASADGKVLYANPAAARRSVWACAAGDPLPGPLRLLVARAMARGEEIQQDIRWDDRIFGVSVTPFPVESYANIYGRDITQRTLAEAALRESELKAATLLNAAGESIWLFGPDGDVLAANTTAARRMGKTVGQVVGTKWAEYMDDNLRKSRGERIAEVLRTGDPVHFEDERAGIVFDHAFYPARDGERNIMGVAAFSRDITERKRTQEALRRSEERLKRAQEIAHLGSWELDLVDNRLIWSDEVYRIFGLQPQEIIATYEAFLERVHPGDREAVDAAYSGSIRENRDTYEIEHRVIRKHTGEIRFVQERCHHYRDESGRIVRSVGMVHDISERKRTQEALRQLNDELEERVARQTEEIHRSYEAVKRERQRFNDVLEMLPSYVVLLTPDYQVSFANRTFRERFGEGPGKRCYEHLFGRTEPCEICETYSVLKTGKPHHWEWTGPDGCNYDVFDFPFTDSEGASFILEMGIDITDVKQAEAALREANETLERRVIERTAELEEARTEAESGKRLLESVMEALPVGVAITNARGGNIQSNQAFDELWGGPRPAMDSVNDYTAYRAWWAETGEPVRPDEWASARAVQKGQTVSGQLLEIQRFDGSRAFILNSASPVIDVGGKIIGSAVAIQDITDLRHAEEALRESEARVRLKLHSILSPEGDIGNLELADIIDAAAIRSLMVDFYDLVRIPMAVIDLKGRVIVGAGWQEICTKFHRVHPETCRYCVKSDTELTTGVSPGRYKLYKCKNNMWDCATPIIVGGKHVGNVFAGQFFFDDERIDCDLFRSQAARFGFNEADYIAALENVPRLNRKEVETGMAFFMKFADLISQMSYANIKLARSVSERDALTASLATSEERLKLFIEHAPAALAMFDRRMCYLGVSRRWRSEYGLGDAELIGVSHYDALPEISEEWREAHRRGLTGEVLRAEADRFVRADGSVHWVHWEVRPWYDAAGTIGGIVIFSEDITELMQVTEALENRSEQLAAANRELESFSYSVSHDLRAPLRAIDGYSRMILRKHAEGFDEDTLAKFNVIRANTQMMGLLINDLLAFSRLDKAHMSISRLEMDDLIREVWEELKAANPDRFLTLTIAEIPPAMGDRGLIRQVLVNILSNAVKFTRERPEALIEVGGSVKDAECIYTVRDNGVGFDMQYHDKMFGVFQRLHSNEEFEGTGVGLAIVQRIIHRHDGRVWAEGEVGKGACLYFSLPW
jgi:PAS domain S-box-containing protein